MDPLVGYRTIPNANPAPEAASDDAAFLRTVAAHVSEALKLMDEWQPVTWAADTAMSDVYSVLEDVAAKLRNAADDTISDAQECE